MKGGYKKQNCTTVPGAAGGRTGHAVQILAGPGKGQYRRVVGVGGPRNRTISLDFAFDPAPTAASSVQIGPMRGQMSVTFDTVDRLPSRPASPS